MTKQEALKSIVEDGINLGAGDYIELEALALAKEALEKQIPKNPIKIQTSPKRFYYACPICENRQDRQEKHCYECGQSLDWSEE